jgi:hypothetical protein
MNITKKINTANTISDNTIVKKRKKMTDETKRKISEAQKNLSDEKRERINYGIRNNRYSEAYAQKLSFSKIGETNPQSKLTEDKVIKIKELWNTGYYSTTVLGGKFGVSRQSIADIVYGRTWKYLDKNEED